jgi:hypothetical protein
MAGYRFEALLNTTCRFADGASVLAQVAEVTRVLGSSRDYDRKTPAASVSAEALWCMLVDLTKLDSLTVLLHPRTCADAYRKSHVFAPRHNSSCVRFRSQNINPSAPPLFATRDIEHLVFGNDLNGPIWCRAAMSARAVRRRAEISRGRWAFAF